MIRPDVFGWFDDAGNTPVHDPGMAAKCPACGEVLARPVRTISLMPAGVDRSYFFRAHKGCWDALPPEDQSAIESSLIDAAIEPLFPHDCDGCVFLGRGDDEGKPCDLYVCRCGCGCGRVNLIAMYGEDGYSSWRAEWEPWGVYVDARKRAADRRLFGVESMTTEQRS